MKRVLWALLIFTAVSSVTFAQSSRQPQQQNPSPNNGRQVTEPDQRGTENNPLSVKLLNTGKSDQEAADEAAHVTREENTESWTIKLTIAAIGVGLLQLLAFVVQAIYMRGTVNEMRRANRSAESANKTAERALLVAERPWVGVETIGLPPQEPAVPVANLSKIQVVIKNSGKTPSLKTAAIFSGSLRGFYDDPPAIPPVAANAVTSVIFPGGELRYWPFANWNVMSAEQTASVATGHTIIWVMCRITYEDGAGIHHSTTARFQWNPVTEGFHTSGDDSHAD